MICKVIYRWFETSYPNKYWIEGYVWYLKWNLVWYLNDRWFEVWFEKSGEIEIPRIDSWIFSWIIPGFFSWNLKIVIRDANAETKILILWGSSVNYTGVQLHNCPWLLIAFFFSARKKNREIARVQIFFLKSVLWLID